MVPRTGSHHMRLPPASCFCPGVAPLVRRGFLLAGGRGPRQPKALASGDAGATDCELCAAPHNRLKATPPGSPDRAQREAQFVAAKAAFRALADNLD